MTKAIAFLVLLITTTFSVNALAEIKIGVILPFTGDFARYGEKIKAGLEKGAIPGVSYVYEDEGCDPRKAVEAYHKLASVNGIKLFLGPWCGSPQMVVAPLIKKNNHIALLGASAPRAVYDASGGRMLSVMHAIEQESAFNAEKLYEKGSKKVVIIFFENSFSRAHEKAFRDNFRGEVLETIAYSSPDAGALKAIAIRIKQLQPDTLYFPDAFPLMQGVLKQISVLGIANLQYYSVYSAQSEDVLKTVGLSGEGLKYSYPVTPDNEDALNYYPVLASKLLSRSTIICAGDINCVLDKLKSENSFDQFGVLANKLALKQIAKGEFVWEK